MDQNPADPIAPFLPPPLTRFGSVVSLGSTVKTGETVTGRTMHTRGGYKHHYLYNLISSDYCATLVGQSFQKSARKIAKIQKHNSIIPLPKDMTFIGKYPPRNCLDTRILISGSQSVLRLKVLPHEVLCPSWQGVPRASKSLRRKMQTLI